MANVERVCVICRKEERGTGVWSYHDDPSTLEREDGLCPDCCRELFPQYYKCYDRPAKGRFSVGGLLQTLFHQLRSVVQPSP